jgi:uncharacterized protein (DUF2062 family)
MPAGDVAIGGDTMKLRSRTFFQKLFRPAVIFVKFRILHVDDTSRRIALGVAVGVWTAFTPFLGLHMFMALAIAALVRANKALAVLFVWVSNPFTMIPVYTASYLVGRFFVGRFHHSSIKPGKIGELLGNLFSFENMLTCLYSKPFWRELAKVFGKIGLEVTVGGFILGLLAALIGYFVTYRIVTTHRTKSGRRRFRHLS